MVEMPKISFMPNIQNINQKKNEPTPQNMSIGRTYSSNKTHKYIAACKCKSTKDNTKNTKNQKKNISHTIKNKRYD